MRKMFSQKQIETLASLVSEEKVKTLLGYSNGVWDLKKLSVDSASDLHVGESTLNALLEALALPTVVNDRYLHTNASTGALEWSEVSGGGGLYRHIIVLHSNTTDSDYTLRLVSPISTPATTMDNVQTLSLFGVSESMRYGKQGPEYRVDGSISFYVAATGPSIESNNKIVRRIIDYTAPSGSTSPISYNEDATNCNLVSDTVETI